MNHLVASFRNPVLEFLTVALRKMRCIFSFKNDTFVEVDINRQEKFSLYFELFLRVVPPK